MRYKTIFWLGFAGTLLGSIGSADGRQQTAHFLTPQAEETLAERVLTAVETEGRGASAYLYRKRPRRLTVDEAMQQVVQRNPSILAQRQVTVSARQLRLQSQAAFDPLLNLAAAYTRTDFFGRSEVIVRQRPTQFIVQGTTQDADGTLDDTGSITGQAGAPEGTVDPISGQTVGEESQPISVTDAFGNLVCVSVNGELVNPEQCALKTEPRAARELASGEADPLEAWSFIAGAGKLFPWGSRLGIELESTRRIKNFFPLDDFGIFRPLSGDDPIGRGSSFPWTTAFTASLDTALPWSKDFGPYGSVANVGVLLAKVGERQADWSLTAAINGTLLAADDAYWELVRSLLQLEIAQNQAETLTARAARADKLYEARQITTYEKAQIDTELANIESQQELAWAAVVRNSNRLGELLDYPEEVILLPQRYAQALQQAVVVDEHSAFSTARLSRPELNVARLGLESSRILFNNSQAQTRPDLFLTFRVALSQDDRVLGYESFEDSLSNTFSPDISDYFVGLSFRVPFGNREVRSRSAQARLQRDQARDTVQQTEIAVIQQINTVMAAINSTQAQIAASEAGLQNAELAFAKAQDLREQGLVTEFELLQKLNDRLFSQAGYIDALIEHRKTQAQLLAAQGTLVTQYGRSSIHAEP
ncbi:MAG: TolC family protein [Gammaproteobacteria bacterium]